MSDHLSSVMRALEHVASGDFARAQHCLESESDSEVVGARYAELTKTLYARNKDVHGMIALGRTGIDYQLRQAERVAADDAALSVRLRMGAKRLAFNVAANCWPGWGDDGVVIEAAHIEEGLRLAKLSLGLVQELALEQRQRGNAFWLVGALDLAAGRTETAMASFDRARACFLSDGGRLEVLLTEGYQAIALSAMAVRESTDGESADVRLDEVVGQLQQDGSEKAEFFARQLRTAARILHDRLRHG